MREVVRHAAGHCADRREHRALGRVAHRRVGGVGRARERRGHEHRVHQLALAARELLGRAAHDLGEDHAAVAAGAEQRGPGNRRHDLVAALPVERPAVHLVELVEHGAHGQRHVVPGVAVGHGEHVEVVDLLPAVLQLGERSRDYAAEPDETLLGHVSFVHRRAAVLPPPAAGLGSCNTASDARDAGERSQTRGLGQSAFVTFDALRHRVQTYSRRGVPFTEIRTFCRFGLKRRLLATIEWLRLWPNAGPFPQE